MKDQSRKRLAGMPTEADMAGMLLTWRSAKHPASGNREDGIPRRFGKARPSSPNPLDIFFGKGRRNVRVIR